MMRENNNDKKNITKIIKTGTKNYKNNIKKN